MPDPQLKALEQRIDELIKLCTDLNGENANLKAEAHIWQDERRLLKDKNQLAKTKVETIISRLKALEQDS